MTDALQGFRVAIAKEPLAFLLSRRDNIVRLVARPDASPDAMEALILVEESIGRSAPEDPAMAVLKAVGYAVGVDGPKPDLRALILERVLEGRLPRVARADELDRWGEPGSLTRYRTVYTRIRWYRDRFGRGPKMEQAVLRWTRDLDHVASCARARFGGRAPMPHD